MIRRSRPKYLLASDIDKSKKIQTKLNEEIYLDRGSSALKFLLKCLVKFYQKDFTVCMQSFNCHTVLDGALEVENIKVLLSDVKLEDYSVSLEFIKENTEKIDVLFLLHYQGKINNEYDEIIKYCSQNNIIVIEDLAHINENNFELKGDYGIYSYSFDKPYTCMSGGKIIFKNEDAEISRFVLKEYYLLKYEDDKKSYQDIKLLEYFLNYSSVEYYNSRIDNSIAVEKLLKFCSPKTTYNILNNKFLSFGLKVLFKIYFKIFKNNSKENYPVLRINDMKINLIKQQSNRYFEKSKEYEKLQNEIIEKLKNLLKIEIDKKSEWNRVSFLDINKNLILQNIEKGNFNWSAPLNKLYEINSKVILIDNYKNTEYLSKNIVNFPSWTDEIVSEFTKVVQ